MTYRAMTYGCDSIASSCAPDHDVLLLSLSSVLHRPFVEAVTMYSWLVTVLLLASAANGRGQCTQECGV